MKRFGLTLTLLLALSGHAIAWSGAIQAVLGTPAADTTPPTISTATIGTSGTTMTLAMSEAVSIGAGGSGGFTPTLSGGAASMTYSSGSGTSSLVYALGRTVNSGETGTLAYVQPGNGVEDTSGNDLASFSGTTVTNNSTQSAAGPICDPTNSGSNAYLFCTGWEEGSGVLNTGATLESTFTSASGTASVTTATGMERSHYLQPPADGSAATLEKTGLGSNGNLYFRYLLKWDVSSGSPSSGSTLQIWDMTAGLIVAQVNNALDSSYHKVVNVYVRTTTGGDLTKVGSDCIIQATPDTAAPLIEVVGQYANVSSGGTATYAVYNSDGSTLCSTQTASVTATYSNLSKFYFGNMGGNAWNYKLDGLTIHTNTIQRFFP